MLGVTLSLEKFLNSWLTNVKASIFACSVKAGARVKWVTSLGRVFKIRQYSHAILCKINGISRASLTPLGRVFKIHDIFLHDFIGFLTSINYMDKWVTPLGVR